MMRKTNLSFKTAALFMVFYLTLFVSRSQAQCVFNCNDTVHVSVNNMCMALITPDVILEGVDSIPPGCTYGVEMFDQNGLKISTSPEVGKAYVGQILKVRIFEQGGPPTNSCWAFIKLEDKLPPDIICPPNDTVKCWESDLGANETVLRNHLKSKIETGLIDNCGDEDIDIVITRNDLFRDCNGPFAGMRIVEYLAIDNQFNHVECVDTIFYERLDFDDVDAPKNYKDNMVLHCNGSWDRDGDDYPSVQELVQLNGDISLPNINGRALSDFVDGNFVERGLCNVKMTYADQLLPGCGASYKLVRTWTVIDWCNASFPIFYYQVIKVVDDNITATFPDDIRDLPANPWTCTATAELVPPVVSDNECSNWYWSIFIREPGESEFKAFGTSRSMNAGAVTRVFPLGRSTVKYVVKDACDNEDIDSFFVEVIDDEVPTAVCDYRTVVTLNDSYLGKAIAFSFDDGSFDGCSNIVSYKVRRVDRFSTNCPTPLDFDDFVKFCCEDLGKTIMIELQVTDEQGLTSICMAEAKVQFKGEGPQIICPVDTVRRDCRTFDNFNIQSLTPPSVQSTNPCLQDNLGTEVRETGRFIDDCGNGYIDVEWIVNLTGTEEVACTQRIYFANLDLFNESDINWPGTRTLVACGDLDPTDAEINNLYDRDRPCSNIVYTYEDQIFPNTSSYCLKVLRTWTIIDWCQFNPAISSSIGKWTHVQKLFVVGSDFPVFQSALGIITINEDQDNCRGTVVARGLATDDCTDEEDLVWTHQLELIFGSASILIIPESPGREFTRTLDVGTYLIKWTVTDECGNKRTANQIFEINDGQSPVALCKSLSKDLQQGTGVLVVQAEEFNANSEDNCDSQLQFGVRRKGSSASPSSSITFTCADIGVIELEFHVTDNSGNSDFCTVFIDVRDGFSACQSQGASIHLTGMVLTPRNEAVENAEIGLHNMTAQIDMKYMTPVSGMYAFDALSSSDAYMVDAKKNDLYINGVSTLDLILIQKHILSLIPLDSPYKIIAADASNDQSVSGVDLVLLRRLILGQINKFPNNDSWRFIPKTFKFDNPSHPWPFEENIHFENAGGGIGNTDFIGVKVGDVDQNATANSKIAKSRSLPAYGLSVEEIRTRNTLTVQLSGNSEIMAYGMQMAWEFDKQGLMLKSIESNQVDLSKEMIHEENGILTFLWFDRNPHLIKQGEMVITMNFDVIQQGHSGVNPVESWPHELYDENLVSHSINLEWNDGGSGDVWLYQNRPNPFSSETSIDFYLPEAGEAQLYIYDLNGKVVYDIKDQFTSGRNRININRADLKLSKGIYYYQLKTQSRSLAKKMIII